MMHEKDKDIVEGLPEDVAAVYGEEVVVAVYGDEIDFNEIDVDEFDPFDLSDGPLY